MLFKDYKFGTVGLFRSGQVLGGQKPWLLLVSGFKVINRHRMAECSFGSHFKYYIPAEGKIWYTEKAKIDFSWLNWAFL